MTPPSVAVPDVVPVNYPLILGGNAWISAGDKVTGWYLYTEDTGWFSAPSVRNVYYPETGGMTDNNFSFTRAGNIRTGAAWVYTNAVGEQKVEIASGCEKVFNRTAGVDFSPVNVRVVAGSPVTKVFSYNGKSLGGIWGGSPIAVSGSGVYPVVECVSGCMNVETGIQGLGLSVNGGEERVNFPTSYTLTLSCSGPTGSYCDFNFSNMKVMWRDANNGLCTKTLPSLPAKFFSSPTPTPRTIWRSCTFCDANRDGRVCKDDLTIINSCYGYDRNSKSGSRLNSTCNAFDMNYDGKINIQDLTRCGGVCMACAKPTPILDTRSQSTINKSTLFVPITTKRR